MIYQELKNNLDKCENIKELQLVKKQWEEKHIANIQKQIISVDSIEEKKRLGIEINKLKNQLNIFFEESKQRLWNKKISVSLDLSIFNQNIQYISFNILSEIKNELISFFKNWNFDIQFGNEIVTEEENFDNLLIPKDHPSRSQEETYYFAETLLRTHCTGTGISTLKNNKDIISRIATIGMVYRKDNADPRHTPQFNQLDFLWVQKDLNVSHLKWFILEIFKHIFGENEEFRFRNSYFPFTEPSYEVDIKCSCSTKDNCSICGNTRWIEVLGCGLLHQNILKNCGYGNEFTALAAGMGLERLALIKYHITDIRNLYKNNLIFSKHAN